MDKLEVKPFLFAIGDYSRFSILAALSKRNLNVGGIVSATGIEQSNVSHHMACLLNCGFVDVRKNGNERIYGLNHEVRPIVNGIMRHVEKYKESILACDVANKDYIRKVIE